MRCSCRCAVPQSRRHTGWPAICALFSVCRGQTCGQQPKSGEPPPDPDDPDAQLAPATRRAAAGHKGYFWCQLDWLQGFLFLWIYYRYFSASIRRTTSSLASLFSSYSPPVWNYEYSPRDLLTSPSRLHTRPPLPAEDPHLSCSVTSVLSLVTCHPSPRGSLCYNLLSPPSRRRITPSTRPALCSCNQTPLPRHRRRGWCETTTADLPEG